MTTSKLGYLLSYERTQSSLFFLIILFSAQAFAAASLGLISGMLYNIGQWWIADCARNPSTIHSRQNKGGIETTVPWPGRFMMWYVTIFVWYATMCVWNINAGYTFGVRKGHTGWPFLIIQISRAFLARFCIKVKALERLKSFPYKNSDLYAWNRETIKQTLSNSKKLR